MISAAQRSDNVSIDVTRYILATALSLENDTDHDRTYMRSSESPLDLTDKILHITCQKNHGVTGQEISATDDDDDGFNAPWQEGPGPGFSSRSVGEKKTHVSNAPERVRSAGTGTGTYGE